MADLKTQKNDASVVAFLNQIENEQKRRDAFTIHELMRGITGEEPAMWGDSIVGYGSYHYHYKTGRAGDWLLTGFSPRKQSFSIYIMSGFSRFEKLLPKLGKYKSSVSCLYIKKLEDVDINILKEIITESVAYMKNKKWPC